MEVQERPRWYALSHFFFGFAGAFYPIVLVLALLYQFGQQFADIRIFPLEGKIRPGNSWSHTSLKLFEMFIGQILAYLFISHAR